MGNLSTFFFIFVAVLIVAGWISSEMISSKAARANKKSTMRAAKLEKENNQLTQAITREQEKYKHLRAEYEVVKEAKGQIREFEKEYKKVVRVYNKFSDSITSLKEMASAKKYSSNALARDVIAHIEENCPNKSQMNRMKDESTKEVFKRIKKRIDTNPK